MVNSSFTVLGLAGSLRRDSYNRALLHHAAETAPDGVEVEVFAGLRDIPHYDQDVEAAGLPAEVVDLNGRIRSADAVLVATPEYNSAMPGVLKNALDWASRPHGAAPLADKPAAVMGASPGRFGAARAQAQARAVLTAIGADVLDRELAVPGAHGALDGASRVIDAEVAAAVEDHLAALLAHAGGPAPATEAASAAYGRECQERRAG